MTFHSKDNDKEQKTTSEKPVSLVPLNFVEAVIGLLKIKPKSEMKEHPEKEGKSKDNKQPL